MIRKTKLAVFLVANLFYQIGQSKSDIPGIALIGTTDKPGFIIYPGCCWHLANSHQPSDYSKRTFIKDFYFIKPRFLRHGK